MPSFSVVQIRSERYILSLIFFAHQVRATILYNYHGYILYVNILFIRIWTKFRY